MINRQHIIKVVLGISVIALTVAALASALAPIFSDEFTTTWEEFTAGTVNGKLLTSENDKPLR
jgi:hypothetical protein